MLPWAYMAKKNAAAQALTALRNKKLTPEQRRESAAAAAAARWAGHVAKRPASSRKKTK